MYDALISAVARPKPGKGQCAQRCSVSLPTPPPQSPSMLAARASAARRASRLARNFATAVDAAGVKVAAVDNGQPTSAVTFLVKGGSRFESKPGVAHALKGFAFKVSSLQDISKADVSREIAEHCQAVVFGYHPRSGALWWCAVRGPHKRAPRSDRRVLAW